MTSSLDLIRGRQVVSTLTNQSGGPVIAGDVVVVDTAHDESFITTTTAAYNASQVGIALDSIAAAASGRVLLQGYAPLVNVSASATRAYYLFTHTVAKQATSSASFVAGAFGQVLKAGTTPSAFIFPPAIGSTAGITRSGSTTGDHLAVWNGSNADSLKDGGVAPSFVVARYTTNAAQSIANTGTPIIDFEDVDYDPGNTVTTGASWHFTAPSTGYYRVTVLLTFASTAVTAGNGATVYIYKNTSSLTCLARDTCVTATYLFNVGGATTVSLAANDTLDVRIGQNLAASIALLNNGVFNHISIEKVG